MEPKLFTVRLTENERARLEAHRARLGLRSLSDVIRYWINSQAPALVVRPVNVADLPEGGNRVPDGKAAGYRIVQLGPTPSPAGSRLKRSPTVSDGRVKTSKP